MEAIEEKSLVKEARKTFSRIGWAYLLATVIGSAVIIGVSLILKMVNPSLMESTTFAIILNLASLYLCGLTVAFLIIRKMPVSEVGNKKLPFGYLLASLPIGYSLMILFNLVGTSINSFFGKLTGEGMQNPTIDMISEVNPYVILICTVILAPLMEELFFRKFLIDRIYRFGEIITLLTSGLMFGLFHGNFAQFFYSFALGVFLAYIYIRTGKVKYTIIIHMFVNFLGSIATILTTNIDVNELTRLLESENTEEYTAYVMDNALVFGLIGLYGLLVFAIIITGIILMIIFRKKFKLKKDSLLNTRKGLNALFVNSGMIVFILFFVAQIVLAQFGI